MKKPFSKSETKVTQFGRDDDPPATVVARSTFFGLADMTPRCRKQIAAWLRRQADFIEREGANCSDRFIARFFWK